MQGLVFTLQVLPQAVQVLKCKLQLFVFTLQLLHQTLQALKCNLQVLLFMVQAPLQTVEVLKCKLQLLPQTLQVLKCKLRVLVFTLQVLHLKLQVWPLVLKLKNPAQEERDFFMVLKRTNLIFDCAFQWRKVQMALFESVTEIEHQSDNQPYPEPFPVGNRHSG